MIFIGSDHGGLELKNEVLQYIKNELKEEIIDKGCYSKDSVDYPDIAKDVCSDVLKNNAIGILICGTGIGISIAANKIDGIRCALCSEEYSASMAKRHNNANVLALGGRTIGAELAKSIVKSFLQSQFEGGRHEKRVNKIMDLQK
ncbi:MAG: ribose 5-phosphate isomerase B [Spirochaetes bacterium GWD1_27_9]|nr:MAG: ribose 5-phosphate isomerase B [Spirochaetes bacterium GWB1_27_13]OHD28072.1 MAG: ribose 5-phosphate isomerase B [Spirochaetes bacterium GWC1_27_15]OHD41753.1 MAG: ribose 5-phosphate isomerase B [Spirochaetes bacterium GWD1_27_9]